MSAEFSYRGYKGSCQASIEDQCLHGRIQDIDDLITYEGESVSELQTSFQVAVDEYLAHCQTIGKEPNKPYSGTFNVRVGAELHKAATQRARENNQSLNELVRLAIETFVNQWQEVEKSVVDLDIVGDNAPSTQWNKVINFSSLKKLERVTDFSVTDHVFSTEATSHNDSDLSQAA